MSIRSVLLAAAAFAFLPFQTSQAQPRPGNFGFGIQLGEPTGFTMKGSLGGNNSWDAGLGASWFGRLRIHGDYLWAANVFNSSRVGLYFGVGAAIGFGRGGGVLYRGQGGEWYYYEEENATAIAARVPVGVNFMPFSAPVEIFGELAPIIGLVPAAGLGWDSSIGIRYYP